MHLLVSWLVNMTCSASSFVVMYWWFLLVASIYSSSLLVVSWLLLMLISPLLSSSISHRLIGTSFSLLLLRFIIFIFFSFPVDSGSSVIRLLPRFSILSSLNSQIVHGTVLI